MSSHDIGYPDPNDSDGTIVQTIRKNEWTCRRNDPSWAPMYPLSAETSFTLPADADHLYVIAKGSRHRGSIHVTHSPEIARTSVRVDIRVAYHDEDVLDQVAVCKLKDGTNEHGIGVYSSKFPLRFRTARDLAYFMVVVKFPSACGEEPLRIKHFSSDTNDFSCRVGALWDTIMFDHIVISTLNGNIDVESVAFKEGLFGTTNGSICGHYNASRSLRLGNVNGMISSVVTLLSEQEQETKLELVTSNGAIESQISLVSDAISKEIPGGRFKVKARTTNGPVDVIYSESPLASVLHSDVSTTNGGAAVHMDSAFEGSFEAHSALSRLTLREQDVRDPSGRGRERSVQINRRNVIRGTVCWVEPGGRRIVRGHSKISTTNAKALLAL